MNTLSPKPTTSGPPKAVVGLFSIFGTVVFVLLSLAPQVALAQDPSYPPDEPSLGLSSSSVAPGESVLVSGAGYCPDSTVNLSLGGSDGRVATEGARTGDEGAFSQRFKVPAGTDPGSYTLRGRGSDSNCEGPQDGEANLRVTDGDEAGAGAAPTTSSPEPSQVDAAPDSENRPSPTLLYVTAALAAMAFAFQRLILN